jgi:hypothetical protein
LVIGVIGHRDLRNEDREPLTAQVRGVFAELQTRYPSTPLLLLSALAEGADQLVAQVALEKGVRLIVPLPLPKALYEEGFQTQASRDEFNQLLQRAEYWFELPLPQDVRAEEIRRPGLAHDQQYAKGGAYQSPLDEPERGALYHIVTPRVTNPTPVGQPFALHKLTSASRTQEDVPAEQDSDGLRPKSKNDSLGEKQNHERGLDRPKQEFDRVLERLDTFNHDVIHLGPPLTKKREQSKAYLLGTSDTIPVPPLLKQTLYRYAELYAMADSLAIHFRDRTVNTLLASIRGVPRLHTRVRAAGWHS